MPEDSNKQNNTPEDVHRTEKVSAFRNAAEMEAKFRRDEELKERQRQAEAEEAAYQAREEYAKELAEEKIDLIRLRQGVITDSDKVFKEEEPEKEYTLWQKIGNWFYHSKWWLGIATFCVILVAFLVYDYVTREDPDLRLMILTDNQYLYAESESLCSWLNTMGTDYNGDGEVLTSFIYIPVSEDSMEMGGNYSAANNTQLVVQFQTNTCMLVLADSRSEEYLEPKDMFVDLEELYPDCPFAEGYKINLNGTDFADQAGLSEPLKDGSYLALRIVAENMNTLEENQTAYDQAKALLDRIVPELHAKESDA